MKADEEYKALKAERTKRISMTEQQLTRHRSACLVALAYPHQVTSQPEGVVGTLDLYAVRALEGEVLIGKLCSSIGVKSCWTFLLVWVKHQAQTCQVIVIFCSFKAHNPFGCMRFHADAVCDILYVQSQTQGSAITPPCRQQCQCCLLGQCVRSTERQKARCGWCTDTSSQAACQDMG